jgi:hypothetical protein
VAPDLPVTVSALGPDHQLRAARGQCKPAVRDPEPEHDRRPHGSGRACPGRWRPRPGQHQRTRRVEHRRVEHEWVKHEWVEHEWVEHEWVEHEWVEQHGRVEHEWVEPDQPEHDDELRADDNRRRSDHHHHQLIPNDNRIRFNDE